MKSNAEKDEKTVRVELKYCEHCGGLWVRERGAGGVYCQDCQPKVAELPAPKKKPGKVKLPIGRETLVERYAPEEDDNLEFEAAGGVA